MISTCFESDSTSHRDIFMSAFCGTNTKRDRGDDDVDDDAAMFCNASQKEVL